MFPGAVSGEAHTVPEKKPVSQESVNGKMGLSGSSIVKEAVFENRGRSSAKYFHWVRQG